MSLNSQQSRFSPTAIASGSSAIVKVSGQNSFGFLGQIRLGLPKGSAEGFTKAPPRFSKFRGVSGSLGQIRLGLPKGSGEGSTKVPRRLRKFVISLVFWGRSLSFPKGSAEGPPITSLHFSEQN